MAPIRNKHLVIGFFLAFILFLFFSAGGEDAGNEFTMDHSLEDFQAQPSLHIQDNSQAHFKSSNWSPSPSPVSRQEILKTKVKGYRESTYWGEETALDEKVREMDSDEFNRFLDELEENDSHLYWGGEY
jgi:hypothetical protein